VGSEEPEVGGDGCERCALVDEELAVAHPDFLNPNCDVVGSGITASSLDNDTIAHPPLKVVSLDGSATI
jgi:hypothetical protein